MAIEIMPIIQEFRKNYPELDNVRIRAGFGTLPKHEGLAIAARNRFTGYVSRLVAPLIFHNVRAWGWMKITYDNMFLEAPREAIQGVTAHEMSHVVIFGKGADEYQNDIDLEERVDIDVMQRNLGRDLHCAKRYVEVMCPGYTSKGYSADEFFHNEVQFELGMMGLYRWDYIEHYQGIKREDVIKKIKEKPHYDFEPDFE